MNAEPTVTISQREWDALRSELAAMRARLDALDGTAPPVAAGDDREREPDGPRALSRRRALAGLAGAAAAGVAAVATTAEPAAAANGANIVIGATNNTGTGATALTLTGGAAPYGLGVFDGLVAGVFGSPGVHGHANGDNFDVAVSGRGTNGATGVRAFTNAGTALLAESETGYGASIKSTSTQLNALQVLGGSGGGIQVSTTTNQLELSGGQGLAPPDRSNTSPSGAVAASGDGTLWYCIESGTPGKWRKLAGPTSAGALHILPAPKRVYDSRPGTSPSVGSKTPLAPNVARVLDLKVNGSGVPTGATGALLTVLLVNAAAGSGNITVWANGVAKPTANTMVWGPTGGRFTATAVTALSSGAGIQVEASLTTDLVIDVVGYYR